MIKYFCDMCGKEVKRNYISERFHPKKGNFKVEVMVAFDNTWNDGIICKDCLWDILKTGKES